jgi:hypothetical protein
MAWRRKLLALTTVLLGVGLVVTAARPVQPTSPSVALSRITHSANATVALAAARRQHQPIEVTSEETPTRKVSAQPDGTMTAELSAVPTQVRRGDVWVPIDATLTRNRDNTVTPKAVSTDTTLSGGGTGPLMKYGPITITWPGALPAPVLDGPTATYRDVLPGVDLRMTADNDDVAQHLVVKTPEAARNPALARIRLGLKADGLTLSVADGAIQARDANGAITYQTPPAAMWDAAVERRSAPVGLELGRNELTLVPDQTLLTDPKATFPITIDPDWHTFVNSDWAKVFSGKSNRSYFYGGLDTEQDGSNWAKVGKCDFNYCNGIGTSRTYWQFDTSFLAGKTVRTVYFDITTVYSPSCHATADNELWIANSTFGSGLTWDNQPGATHVDTQSIPMVYDGCAGYKGVTFNVGGYYSPSSWSAYFIKGRTETTSDEWRKYDPRSPRIRANYNTRPSQPTELSTDPTLAVCKWCGGKAYVGDDNIRLRGRIGDADGADQLTAKWDVTGAPKPNDGPTLTQGSIFSTNVNLTNVPEGQQVDWKLSGNDGWDTGPTKTGQSFVVDRTEVDRPPIIRPGSTRPTAAGTVVSACQARSPSRRTASRTSTTTCTTGATRRPLRSTRTRWAARRP